MLKKEKKNASVEIRKPTIFLSPYQSFNVLKLRVRIANELGAGNAKGANFATVVSVVNTLLVGFIFWLIVLVFNEMLALIFTSSSSVIQMVNELAILLAFTILLSCIQPVLSGEYLIYFISIHFSKDAIFDVCPYCIYPLVFRGSSWIWSTSRSGLYKYWQLLHGWHASWGSPRLVATFGYYCKCTFIAANRAQYPTLGQVITISLRHMPIIDADNVIRYMKTGTLQIVGL